MKNTFYTLSLALCGLLLPGLSASAGPIATATYGGHTYELWAAPANSSLVDGSGHPLISWSDAEAAAVADGGYLAVLTSAAETTAVYNGLIGNGFFVTPNTFAYYNSAWVGGQPGVPGTTDPSNWTWVDGETWNAFDTGNWAGGEPNGDSAGGGLSINRYGTTTWNDNNIGDGGYIVETPDGGSTLLLLGMVAPGLAAFKRLTNRARQLA